MRDVNLNIHDMDVYFHGYFRDDLRRYFHIEISDNGAQIINNICLRGKGYIRSHNILQRSQILAAAAFALNQEYAEAVAKETRLPNGNLGEEYMFIGLCSALYLTQDRLYQTRILYNGVSVSIDKDCECYIEEFGKLDLPWISRTHQTIYGLNHFLELSGVLEEINFKKGIETTRNAVILATQFLADKILPQHLIVPADDIIDLVNRELVGYYRMHIKKTTNLTVKSSSAINVDVATYYRERYNDDLNKYFKCHGRKIYSIDFKSLGRWEDGNPSGDTRSNMYFSSIFLYIYTAQQAMYKVISDDAKMEFCQISGLPWILTGPGGGDRLHPLKAIEYGGILPSKSEVPLYVEVLKDVANFMNQEFEGIISAAPSTSIIPSKREELLNYLDCEMKGFIELLLDWEHSSDVEMFKYLTGRGINLMVD